MAVNSPQNPNGPGDLVLDANGVAVTLNATVKLVGTVTNINPLSTHYQDIEVTLSHPVNGSAFPGRTPSEGAHGTQPGSVLKINVPACNLIVGA